MLPQITAPLKDEKLKRYFTILKIVLFCMPFMCMGYLGMFSGGTTLDTQSVIAANPTMAISFLSAMLQPYAAWLVILAERRLADNRGQFAVVSLTLLLVAELFLMSSVGVIGTALVLWKSIRYSGYGVPAAFRSCTPRSFIYEAGGTIPMLLFASICLFASLRLGVAF